MNLKQETIEILHEHGRKKSDIKFALGSDFRIAVNNFWHLADTDYDSGWGSPKVAQDLVLLGDDFWLERHEYDGSEWWEFKEMPTAGGFPVMNVKALTVEQSNEKFGNYKIGWETLQTLNEVEE